jgi:hypothetical protein
MPPRSHDPLATGEGLSISKRMAMLVDKKFILKHPPYIHVSA